MEDSEGSCYSNDEEYFLDVCRAGELAELQQFVQELTPENQFDWTCITNTHDNFLHMIAANNRVDIFDYLFPLVAKKIGTRTPELLDKQNSTGNTPLHYAVITDSKEMVIKLLEANANTNIQNECGRTPFDEAEKFDKSQIAELKKEVELLEVCNEDSSDEEEDQPDKEITPTKKQQSPEKE